LLAALPVGATPQDTGEFLLGTVSVTPVFFDSNGQTDTQTQHWSDELDGQGRDEIDQVMAKLEEGLDWWVDTLAALGTVHDLEFQIDRTYVDSPFPTQYEPIDRNGSQFNLYVTEFLAGVGHDNVNSIEAGVRRFNHQQRIAHGTDWAFTIFVVDASDDADDRFAIGSGHRGAFAFPGGLFFVIPSTRSAAIFAHETGHIFWAMDEYESGHSWSETRGYYNTQNLNGIRGNPDPAFEQEISIMLGFDPLDAAFAQNVSPATTLAMVGWQDSDGDGVFDLADVPLELEAAGYFDEAAGEYRFAGIASAVPLINQNTAGPQSDITLNRISQIQYRLDDGPWQMAAEPDTQRTEFDLTVPISQPFDTIAWRAIDLQTGITSNVIDGTRDLPSQAPAAVSGIAFVDHDGNGDRGAGEELLPGTTLTIQHADGSPPFAGRVEAGDYDDGLLPGPLTGLSFAIEGDELLTGNVATFVSAAAGDQRVFYSYDPLLHRYADEWSESEVFGVEFDEPVEQVTLDVISLDDNSFGRLEAYSQSGELIARTTSASLAAGESTALQIGDSAARIARIRAFGHAGSSVAISKLVFGTHSTTVTDEHGRWSWEHLADGEYLVKPTAANVIYQFDTDPILIQVSGGTSLLEPTPAARVDSIRHNEFLAHDATGTEGVTARDALVIVNDLGMYGQRLLQPDETEGFDVDVNNDGVVSALDALLVINYLGEQGESEPAGSEPAGERTVRAWVAMPDSPPAGPTPEQNIPEILFGSTGRTVVSTSPEAAAAVQDDRIDFGDLAATADHYHTARWKSPVEADFEEPFDDYAV